VLVKPNFVSTDYQPAATHVDAVRAVLDFLRQRYDGPIVVAEGAALSPTWQGYQQYGYEDLVQEYDVELHDLNADDTVEVTVCSRRLQPLRLRLSRTAAQADFRISVCPPKTHDLVMVTLAIKNMVMGSLVNPRVKDGMPRKSLAQRAARHVMRMMPDHLRFSALAEWAKGALMGRLQGSQKMAMHQGIPLLNLNLALVAPIVWPHLAVIDGWQGMEGEGPSQGDPVAWGVALAGTDPLAVDTLTAHLMGFSPQDIGYFNYCRLLELGIADQDQIRVIGNVAPEQAARSFRPHSTVEKQRRWRSTRVERYLHHK